VRDIVYGTPERFIAWAELKTGCRYRNDAKAIGMLVDHKIAAAVIFDTFSTTDCLIHVASDGSRQWLTREFLARTFAYPFIQLAYPRATCIISETNEASLRFARHIGWVEEGRRRRGGPAGEDEIMFGMLRHECRWVAGITDEFRL
jgi:RimJ/RimL family protein N-acetyltransferase